MLHDVHSLQCFARLLGIGRGIAYEPTPALVDAAARDIPAVLSQLDGQLDAAPASAVPSGEKAVQATELISQLQRRGHVRAIAAWGIFRLVERGFLGAEVIQLQVLEENRAPFTTIYRLKPPRDSIQLVEFAGLPRCAAVVTVGLPPDTWDSSECQDQPVGEEPDRQEAIKTHTVNSLMLWSTPMLWAWWQCAPGASPSLAAESVSEWDFQPGAAFHRGRKILLSRLPMRLLQEFVKARGRSLTLKDIRSRVWEGQIVSESRVRGLVSELRTILRMALKLPKEYDPILNVDEAAWRLEQLL
jgi:hypothetical protein